MLSDCAGVASRSVDDNNAAFRRGLHVDMICGRPADANEPEAGHLPKRLRECKVRLDDKHGTVFLKKALCQLVGAVELAAVHPTLVRDAELQTQPCELVIAERSEDEGVIVGHSCGAAPIF